MNVHSVVRMHIMPIRPIPFHRIMSLENERSGLMDWASHETGHSNYIRRCGTQHFYRKNDWHIWCIKEVKCGSLSCPSPLVTFHWLLPDLDYCIFMWFLSYLVFNFFNVTSAAMDVSSRLTEELVGLFCAVTGKRRDFLETSTDRNNSGGGCIHGDANNVKVKNHALTSRPVWLSCSKRKTSGKGCVNNGKKRGRT